jgi:hypothetical protein
MAAALCQSKLLHKRPLQLKRASVATGYIPRRPVTTFGKLAIAIEVPELCKRDSEQTLHDMRALAFRIVPFATVLQTGAVTSQLCLHFLDGDWLPTSMAQTFSYHVGQDAPLEASSLLRSLGLLIGAIHLSVAPEEHLWRQSSAHKCTSTRGAGDIWWCKACSSDREAVNLICEPPEPCSVGTTRPVRPLCYLYHGGGIDMQPPGVISVVVRTRSILMAASTIAAAKLLASLCGDAPLYFDLGSIAQHGEPDAFGLTPSGAEILAAYQDVCRTCNISDLCSGDHAMCVLITLLQTAGDHYVTEPSGRHIVVHDEEDEVGNDDLLEPHATGLPPPAQPE